MLSACSEAVGTRCETTAGSLTNPHLLLFHRDGAGEKWELVARSRRAVSRYYMKARMGSLGSVMARAKQQGLFPQLS